MEEQQDNDMSTHAPLSPIPRPSPIDPESLEVRSSGSRQHKRHSFASDSGYQLPTPYPLSQSDAIDSARSRHAVSGPRLATAPRLPLPMNMLPSAPASPPTPAPSPGPFSRQPSWKDAAEDEDAFTRQARAHFRNQDDAQRQRFLAEMLNMCDSSLLSFVAQFVAPRLKKDPFEHLPDELCLRVRPFIPHAVATYLPYSGFNVH